MSASAYFDAVVIGDDLPAWLVANLLSRRKLNVALITHADRPTYVDLDHRRLPCMPEPCTALDTTVGKQVLSELGLYGQNLREDLADPNLQIAVPGHRFEMPLDSAMLLREMRREFASVERSIEGFHHRAIDISNTFDTFMARHTEWPPRSTLRRWSTMRDAQASGLVELAYHARTLLRDLSSFHPFVLGMRTLCRFLSEPMQLPESDLFFARLYANALSAHTHRVSHGRFIDTLRTLFTTQRGRVYQRERVELIVAEPDRPRVMRLKNVDQPITCNVVVSTLDAQRTQSLVQATGNTLLSNIPAVATHTMVSLQLVVDTQAIPQAMKPTLYWLPNNQSDDELEKGVAVHLSRLQSPDETLITLQAMVPIDPLFSNTEQLHKTKNKLLVLAEHIVPFYKNHLKAVHFPLEHLKVPQLAHHPLSATQRAQLTELITTRYTHHDYGLLGLPALPCETAVDGVYVCNAQNFPRLGDEGIFWAARQVAERIVGSNRRYRQLQHIGLKPV